MQATTAAVSEGPAILVLIGIAIAFTLVGIFAGISLTIKIYSIVSQVHPGSTLPLVAAHPVKSEGSDEFFKVAQTVKDTVQALTDAVNRAKAIAAKSNG